MEILINIPLKIDWLATLAKDACIYKPYYYIDICSVLYYLDQTSVTIFTI